MSHASNSDTNKTNEDTMREIFSDDFIVLSVFPPVELPLPPAEPSVESDADKPKK